VHSERQGGGRIGRWTALAAITVVVLVSIYGFRHVGAWLVVQDRLQKADAIVVLSGGLPDRALAAAELYRSGYAPEVWLSQPVGPQAALQAMGIRYAGEETYNQAILIHRGVPADAVHILAPTIVDTEQEIRAISAQLQRTRGNRVIIVTSPYHTRRVRTLWKELAPPGLRSIVRADAEPYDTWHWWRHTRDSLAVFRETLGLLNAWAGLPVRPRNH
jgi:uncharacterized SAM-binding protein YcdF (DUF218 family)